MEEKYEEKYEKEREKVMDIFIEKAKKLVERGEKVEREWLEAEPPNSYSSSDYRVRLFVLEGSPPKGYVLADYASGVVRAFGLSLRALYTYRDLEYIPIC